jgi:hypothetical protein
VQFVKKILKNILNDKIYISIQYWRRFKKFPDFKHPKTFNEKLQWLKLYDRKEEYTIMVDKYKVRQYIADKIGEQYLIPLLGVWESPDDIDFDNLPKEFVLKCNHNSGLGMCICTNKSELNIEKVRSELSKGLKQDYYISAREWPYKNVERKIIAEKYMVDEKTQDLYDYKILCFHGQPQIIELHRGRFLNHTQDFYDCDWNRLNISQPGMEVSSDEIEKPECLDEMIRLSKILAQSLIHVRVDWYYVNGKIYFGEITFYDGGGFEPFDTSEQDLFLGNLIDISKLDR